MFSRKYIYTDKQHTNKGIMSTILGILDLASIAYAIYNNSYEKTGWDFIYVSSYEKRDNRLFFISKLQ